MSLYADLRRRGQVVVAWDQATTIPTARRQARRDGLRVTASRDPGTHLSRSQRHTRAYHVALVHPDDPTTIIRPDAQEG